MVENNMAGSVMKSNLIFGFIFLFGKL